MSTGLLALTVEFYRTNPVPCTQSGQLVYLGAKDFPYGNIKCGLVCSVEEGPYSPMRNGPSNNIYVIPAPNRLSFNTAMLIAAACCIPAILSLIFTAFKI